MTAKKSPVHPSVKIEPLARKHDRAAFSCGYEELDRYIKERASQEAKKQISAPFVLVERGDNTVIGYYSLSATSILLCDLPEKTERQEIALFLRALRIHGLPRPKTAHVYSDEYDCRPVCVIWLNWSSVD